jgi:hypothetical protein
MEHLRYLFMFNSVLIIVLVTSILLGLIFYWKYHRIFKEFEFQKDENERKRVFETDQSKLNQYYRLRALEIECFKQIFQALSVKTEDTSKPDERVTRYALDLKLLDDVLTVKNKIINPEKPSTNSNLNSDSKPADSLPV